MPPSRAISNTSSTGFFNKKPTPFKPPGPAKSSSNSNDRTSSGGSNAAAATVKPATMTISDDEEDFGTAFDIDDVDMEDLVDSPPIQTPAKPNTAPPAKDRPRFPQPQTTEDEAIPGIPPTLLTRIMHEFYADKDTKISRNANAMMRRYVDIFVREAVARAAEGQKEAKKQEEEASGGNKTGKSRALPDDIYLDVEDLERITPSMLLDF
ncbi:CENP-S associating centromere protein X-domain-containing protein [Elsinoe ampelina]|uniref:CENP-S associating centromere protein X-domain-containing protein n=1 Tax=Elsinoe ampelina TaxID=302913 RepID=A0A6A6G791_9PEZI|nr:CENP-S associating centromere protein X-domain-containing protein [Elsinoe ampelina]